jgi:hypothetical protein
MRGAAYCPPRCLRWLPAIRCRIVRPAIRLYSADDMRSTNAGSVLFGMTVLWMCSCSTESGSPRVAVESWPVVYGTDDRAEYYDVADPALQKLVASTAIAIMRPEAIEPTTHGVEIRASSLATIEKLCPGQRFLEQPAAAMCSGIVVTPELVLTAGHCARRIGCENMALVMNYFYTAPGVLSPIETADVYACKAVRSYALSSIDDEERVDYAWIELDHPVRSRPAERIEFRTRSEPASAGEEVVIAGFGGGVPLKVGSGRVDDPRAATMDYFVSDADAFDGDSGAAIFDRSGRLLGVQDRGGSDYQPAGDGCNVVSVVADAGSAVQEQATYAFRAVESLCEQTFVKELCCAHDETCQADIVRSRATCSVRAPGATNFHGRWRWLKMLFWTAAMLWRRRTNPRAPRHRIE